MTELRGTLKVVTNDRSVLTFAEGFFNLQPIGFDSVYPSLELGMAGVCLDPEHGYVFVTFVYHDAEQVLRNGIFRFATTPGQFSVRPIAATRLADVLAADRSQASHQIGPCQVSGSSLYVSVGDGEQPNESQSLDSTLGKILRMNLDGEPLPDNPFFTDDGSTTARDFVFAYGLRNPFGLKLVDLNLFAADNGPDIDRFVAVEKGRNYLWNGSEQSIGTNALVVFSTGRGLTQTDFSGAEPGVLGDRWRESFIQVVSGSSEVVTSDNPPQILAIPYDRTARIVREIPRPLFRYRGTAQQTLTGAALGPDGLYVSAMFPNRSGETPIYKLQQGATQGVFVIDRDIDAKLAFREAGCYGCHKLDGEGGFNAPALDSETLIKRIESRLKSTEYEENSRALDALPTEPFVSTRAARRDVREAEGTRKIQLWIKNRILEPRFDNPDARMPKLGVSEFRARVIAEGLAPIAPSLAERFLVRLSGLSPRKAMFGSFVGGVLATLFVLGAWTYARRRRLAKST